MTRRQRLREAAAIVAEIAATLDTTSRPCDGCGLAVSQNHYEKLTADKLAGIEQKLLRIAGGEVFDE